MINATLHFNVWIHTTEAVFVKPMSHIFCWLLSIWAQRLIRMALIIFFHLNCFFFFSPLRIWKAATSERKRARERKGERLHAKERERGWFACQHLYPDREAGRQRGLGGEGSILVQLFKRLLTSFLLRRPRSLGAGSAHSSLWLQLMKHSCASVFPAPGTCKLLRSKPQQCVVADSGMPNLGRAQIRPRSRLGFNMTIVFHFEPLSSNTMNLNMCVCVCFFVSFQLSEQS